MVPAVIPSLEAAAVRPGSVGTCARMVGCVPLSQKISVFSFISNHEVISESQNGFRVQAVLRASMGSSATRSVIVPIMDAATGPMEPVCVILDSTDASATSVSPSVLILPDSYITRLFSKIFWVDLRDIHIFFFQTVAAILMWNPPSMSSSPPCFFSSACPKWTFGPGCSDECRCVQKNTLECHRRHGTCVCKPGYQGNTCKEGESSVTKLRSSQDLT